MKTEDMEQYISRELGELYIGIARAERCIGTGNRTIFQWVNTKKIPSLQVCRKRFIKVSDLQKILKERVDVETQFLNNINNFAEEQEKFFNSDTNKEQKEL